MSKSLTLDAAQVKRANADFTVAMARLTLRGVSG